MARRLEKIEKELGYCEVKLEKERRSCKQIGFIREGVTEFDRMVRLLKPHDIVYGNDANPGIPVAPPHESFLAAGLVEPLEEKKSLLLRELDEVVQRLSHYRGFDEKKKVLEEEKQGVLRGFSSTRAVKLRRINEEFKKTERFWNELTEDLLNLDECIFLVDRNLDYLRSARSFLISSKGSFDIDGWRRDGYLTDLFRHSILGRAREMVNGADRNIRAAQKELVCVNSIRRNERIAPGSGAYVEVLIPFVEALYEDLFVAGQFELTVQVIEAALANNLMVQRQLNTRRENLATRLKQVEDARDRLFHKMGSGQRRELIV